jgi:prepilin-type N-terminal cleavage/methylation domain-containing protein
MDNQKKGGFTLIELLVVIAIIGILAGMVLVSMGGARAKARDARRMADMRQMLSAQEMYYGDYDKYLESATLPGAIGTYLNPVPADPGGGTPVVCTGTGAFTYCTVTNVGTSQKFCYFAYLEQNASLPYFTSSHGGNFKKAAKPSSLDDCATGS